MEVVTDFELEAYVDGQLDPRRRFEVEDHLARNPEAAARVMADLRARDAVRLLAGGATAATPGQERAAVRLRGGLRRARRMRQISRAAAVVGVLLLAAAVGRFAPWESPGDTVASEFVAEAVMAHRTSLMRAAMRSQPEAAVYNPAEIRSATHIALPQLPPAWRVTDVQVFPSDDGPTVAMTLDTRRLGAISLFAARAPEFADREPMVEQSGPRAVAYWQIGDVAYALTGTADPEALQDSAARLATALHERRAAQRAVPLTGARTISQ